MVCTFLSTFTAFLSVIPEHRQANLQSHEATITAVREAVAQHVPMDIKGVRTVAAVLFTLTIF